MSLIYFCCETDWRTEERGIVEYDVCWQNMNMSMRVGVRLVSAGGETLWSWILNVWSVHTVASCVTPSHIRWRELTVCLHSSEARNLSSLTLSGCATQVLSPSFCLSCFVCGENYLSAQGLKAEPEPAVKILYFIQNHLEIPSDGTVQTVDRGIDEFTRWRQNY